MEKTKQELADEIWQLSRVVDDMRVRMARLERGARSPETASAPTSRRRFLTLGAGAALGAVGLAAAKVLPAAAADGATVTTGSTVTGEHPTIIQGDAATAVPVFETKAFGFNSASLTSSGETLVGPLQGLGADGGTDPLTAVAVDGVDGWAGGLLGFGVYGLTDAGYGTVGESSTGISLYARGSGRLRQDPHNLASGVPDYTANDFEQVRDANGALWISGPGGAWMRPSLNSFPNPRRIVGQSMTSGTIYGPFDATKTTTSANSGVPVGAQSAYCAVQSYSPGVLTLFPDGTADTGIANYSGTGTAGTKLNMLYMLVPLSSAGKFKIHSYITGSVYVDVWGFLI